MGEGGGVRPPGPDGPAPWERYFTDLDASQPTSWPSGSPPTPKENDDAGLRRFLPQRKPAEAAERRAVHDVADAPPAQPQAVGPVANNPTPTRLELSKLRRRRRWRIVGRTAMAMCAIMALLATGVVWGYLRSTDNSFLQVAALDENSSDVIDPIGQTGDETYLIIGTDSRAGANSQIGAGTTDDAAGARSDTIMLVNIPENRERVVAVSFPRDLDVTRPECQGWDNDTATYTSDWYPEAYGEKLNAVYALGGPKCLVKAIQKISGLRIGHFVGIDFSGFESMVNEIGGVEVCTTVPLNDAELGLIMPNTGRQTINGATALNYVRARNIETEGNGDYGRIKRQQLFLSSLLRSALSNKVLLDPTKLNGFVSAFTRDTFVEKVTTQDLIRLGRSLQNVEAGAVTFLTAPTSGTNEWGNEIPRSDDIRAIFQAIIDDDPLPGEERPGESSSSTTAAPSAPELIAVSPDTVALQVSNATGQEGRAATAAEELGAYGFPIYSIGNYSGMSSSTVVRYPAGSEAEAATVASTIPGATMQETADLGGIIELVLGSEFDGKVQAPAEAGTGVAPPPPPPVQSSAAVQLPPDLSITNAGDDTCS